MTREELRNNERQALELMPWYVNGTLEGEERELVGRQVLASLPCRMELERLRRLQQLIRRDDPEAVSTDRAFERLMVRIEAGGATQRSSVRHPIYGSVWTRFVLAASLLAAVTVLLWWWTAVPSTTPRIYETLATPSSADPMAVRLRVAFAPDVTESERLQLLAHHGLTIIESPTDDGVVTLAFAGGTDRAAIVAALKKDPRIRLVTSPPGTSTP